MEMELSLARPDIHQMVTVTCHGVFSHRFDLSAFDRAALFPRELDDLPPFTDDPVAYGRSLYSALFPPGTLAHTTLLASPTRIVLVTTSDEVEALPWEYTYGPDGWLVCTFPFMRALPPEQRIAPQPPVGLHLAAVTASPLERRLAPLNTQGEWLRLREIVEEQERAMTLQRVWPPTIERLRTLVAGQQQRVVHFMGHGGRNAQSEAVLCFERENGASEEVTASEFVQRVRGSVLLVTLNACVSAQPGETPFSNLAAALVRAHIPYALGMRLPIHDDDALALARSFYGNLARGVPIEDALLQMRLTLRKSPRAWAVGVPVLYTALSTPASGCVSGVGEPVVLDEQVHMLDGLSALPIMPGPLQGRLDEQRTLGNWLTGDQRPRIMTVYGLGGQGKTALVRVAAERFAHAWPGGVRAITFEQVPTRARFVTTLALLLGLPIQDTSEPAERERLVLHTLRRKRSLLILDNLETLDEAVKAHDAEALDLVALLLQLPGERTSLLCTSRHLLGWRDERPLELSGLTPRAGATLFGQCAPNRADEIDRSLALDLSERIDGHPLGLTLLGSAFNRSPLSLVAFLTEHERFLRTAEDPFAGTDRQRTLYANWAYSVRWLSPPLRDTLRTLWVFHSPFLPDMVATMLDGEHEGNETLFETSPAEEPLYALWQRGLLTREAVEVSGEQLHLYRLPPVLRPYVEHTLTTPDEHEQDRRQFGKACAWLARRVYDMLVDGRAVATLVLVCSDDLERGVSCVEELDRGWYLLYRGWMLHWLGDRQAARAATEQALALAQGHDRVLEGHASNNLAQIFRATGYPREALRLYEQSLAIKRETKDRRGEGATLNNLGNLYHDQGDKDRALASYQQALVITREVADRAGESATLNNLGNLYQALGDTSQALASYQQALVITREVANRAGEGTTLNNLGSLYYNLGDKPKSIAYFGQALIILREVGDRATEGTTLSNLGSLYYDLGDKDQALAYYDQSLVIKREVADRTGEGITLHNIGTIFYKQNRFEGALACFLLAKALFEAVQSPNVEHAMQWIAALRTQLGEEAYAALLARVEPQAHAIVERALREDSHFEQEANDAGGTLLL